MRKKCIVFCVFGRNKYALKVLVKLFSITEHCLHNLFRIIICKSFVLLNHVLLAQSVQRLANKMAQKRHEVSINTLKMACTIKCRRGGRGTVCDSNACQKRPFFLCLFRSSRADAGKNLAISRLITICSSLSDQFFNSNLSNGVQ